MKRYAVHPGWIGDAWFSFERLVQLYGVPKEQCFSTFVVPTSADNSELIHLHPRTDGVYHSPEKTEEK